MMNPILEIQMLLVATSIACALPGVFLVLRRVSLLSDAIGHVLFLGIVLAYFLIQDLKSPWLLLGAAMSGVLTVALIELLQRTRIVKGDVAIGLVFPTMFSIGVLLASMYTRNIHLDADRVLLGMPELSPLRRFEWGDFDLGPRSLLILLLVCVMNLAFVVVWYKELKITTFDAALASTLGFAPALVHYLLMGLVSITAVAAFDAVGPVLVVAFMIVPPATAFLVVHRLGWMVAGSLLFATSGSVLGTSLAFRLNSNVAGTVAVVMGLQFVMVLIFAPRRGLLAQMFRGIHQRRLFDETMLLIHLFHHEGTPTEREECGIRTIPEHLHWTADRVTAVTYRVLRSGEASIEDGVLCLLPPGRRRAEQSLHFSVDS